MKDRPILFTGAMVRAILAGEKIQTRRLLYVAAEHGKTRLHNHHRPPPADLLPFPKVWTVSGWADAQPGDRLVVRESFSGPWRRTGTPPSGWPATDPIHYWADGEPAQGDWTKPKPGIHMPKWASRLTPPIVKTRIERLQECSADDAYDEGAAFWAAEVQRDGNKYPNVVSAYQALWTSINGTDGPGSWGANPWVVVVEFERHKG
jgi:hypothetical protein